MAKKFLIMPLALAVFILADALLVLVPQAGSFGKIAAKYRDISKKLQELQVGILSRSRRMKAKKTLKEEVAFLEKKIPGPKSDLGPYLSLISRVAKKTHIGLVSIDPLSSQKAPKNKYYKLFYLPFKLVIRDTYHNLGRFINALENSSWFLEVKEIKISGSYPKNNIEMVVCGLAR